MKIQAFDTAMRKELQRRVLLVQAYPADAMGHLGALELVAAALTALALPLWVWTCLTS